MSVFDRPYLKSPGHKTLPATQYSGVCSSQTRGVSRDRLKPQNIGSPPGKDLDMALRKWTCPLLIERAKVKNTPLIFREGF